MWREQLFGDEPAELRVPRAIDAWAGYVEAHRETTRMFFRETTGDPEAEATQRAIQGTGACRARRPACARAGRGEPCRLAGSGGLRDSALGLTGLALWWYDHPHVAREQIVRTAVNVLSIGLDRGRAG